MRKCQNRPEVLQLRLHNLMQQKSWCCALIGSAASFAASRPTAEPGSCTPVSVCIPSAKRPQAERTSSRRTGRVARSEPIYYYNMGCYEALLGNSMKRSEHLKISFKMDASFRDLAKRDPDLEAVQKVI